jgi:hypothetical protein
MLIMKTISTLDMPQSNFWLAGLERNRTSGAAAAGLDMLMVNRQYSIYSGDSIQAYLAFLVGSP